MAKKSIDINEKELFHRIFTNINNPFELPVDLYTETASVLNSGVAEGIFTTSTAAKKVMYSELRNNIFMFSGAKTFQQTLAMSEAMVENGELLTFKQFEEKAKQIFDTYNKTYLKTEYETAVLQSQNASRWIDIQDMKEVFPLLKYDATQDAHLCPICKPLDGIVKPVNDPFWSKYYPMNHFNCRCNVRQLESWEEKISKNTATIEKKVSEKMDGMFMTNCGRQGEVFKATGKDQHPYFSVPKKYSTFAKRNFNLKIPKQ